MWLKLARFALILLLACLSPVALRAEWQNSLKPAGSPSGNFALVKDGAAACGIQLATPSDLRQQRAGEELQNWIERIAGARPKVVGSADGPVVRIETDPALGEEGYRVGVDGDDLVLAGGTGRGLLNVVFALLEEDLGCRFYTNASVKLPTGPTLTISPVARQYIPQLKLRDPYYFVAFDPTWSLRNRTNAPSAAVPEEQGGHVDYGGMFVHTAASLVPPGEYFENHPEYFMLDGARKRQSYQVCATEPEVLKIAIDKVLAQLKANPQTEIVSVSKNDNVGDQICQCERCKKLRESEGSDMACQLVLVNGVAEAVEKENPQVVVDTLAYLETINVPKTMRPRANVAVRFCNDSVGAWSRPFTPAESCPAAAIAVAWGAAHNRIYVWDYCVNFSHYLAPMPNIDVIAANIRFWAKNKAEGVMLQGGYQGPTEQDELKAWVAAKLLWDPSRDEKALVQDFIWGHYGTAAPAMAEYESLLDSLRATHAEYINAGAGGIRYAMDAPFLTKDFLDKSDAIFAQAKQLAAADPVVLRRVERATLPVLYVKCSRGPALVGAGYAEVLAEFERIARQEKVTYLEEWGAQLDAKLSAWKAQVPAAVAK